jgi:TPR repeat protein
MKKAIINGYEIAVALQAVGLLESAALAGHLKAMNMLGLLLWELAKKQVGPGHEAAYAWVRQAAEGGLGPAKENQRSMETVARYIKLTFTWPDDKSNCPVGTIL